MRSRWPIIVLAAGLGALHIAISVTFGAAIASAIVAGLGIAYASLNFLLGRPKDDPTVRQSLVRIFAVGRLTYVAAVLVWLAAAAIAALPLIDRMLSDEFTVTLVDERLRPLEDARLEVRFGSDVRRIPLTRGVGRVKYYRASAPATVEIVVDNKGISQVTTHRLNAAGRYDDVVIRVWSGETSLSVSHFSVSGIAIGSFLRGDLPDELRQRYPQVKVVRNAVFDDAREFLAIYQPLGDEGSWQYSRNDPTRPRRARRLNASTSFGQGDAWLTAYERRLRRLPFVQQLYGEMPLDFSTEILGSAADRPLAEGYLARMNSADEWFVGNEAVPTPETDSGISAGLGPVVHGPDGSVSFELERLLNRADLAYMLARRVRLPEPRDNPALDAYLRYMIAHGLPEGLVRGVIHLQWVAGCEYVHPHVALELPEPELRVTLLKNSGTQPVRIDELVLTMETRSGLQRTGAAAPRAEQRIASDLLAPGETLLIPRELSIEAVHSDAEVAEFRAAHDGRIATFDLLPGPAPARRAASLDGPPRTIEAPARLMLPMARVRPYRPPEPSAAEESGEEAVRSFAQDGPAYVVGDSVAEIDYVVSGVRIRARSDARVTIAMVGIWEEGSCPFVFVRLEPGAPPINLGHIIADRIGRRAQGRDRLALPPRFVAIELRELEDEISYIDSARLVVRRGGNLLYHSARRADLARADGRYAVLRKGDVLPLDFGYRPRPGDRQIEVEVNGYYVPLPRAGGARRRRG